MRVSALLNLVAIVAFAAVGGIARAQEARQVAIGISSTSLPGGIARIAREMGLFEKHGLDARVIVMENGAVANAALISKSIQFNTTAGSEVIVAQSRGLEIVAVNSLYSGFSGVVVLSKATIDKLGVSPDAPLSLRAKALDGLTIAAPGPASSFTFALRPLAENAGAKIRFTYMAQNAMVAALESGAVQGFIASAPFYATPVLRGSGQIWVNGPKGEFPAEFVPSSATGLNVLRSYAQASPDVMQRMVAVFEEFATAAKDRPESVKAAIGRLFPDLDARTLDFLFESEAVSFKTKRPSTDDMAREIRFVKASGVDLPNIDRIKPEQLIFEVR